jgi:trimethylamine-N-oxide reductase (cytochrome c)
MVALAAMQGLGKPGRNIWGTTAGAPTDQSFVFPGYSEGGISCDPDHTAAGVRWGARMFPKGGATKLFHHAGDGQFVPRLRIPEAMQHEPFAWKGKGFCGSHIEAQFRDYHYPADGYKPVGMYYRYGGSFFGTMTSTNRYVKAYQNDKIQFVVNQSIWMEGEAKFADVVLPACTNFELRHRRLRHRLRLCARRQHPARAPHDRVPEEMHRAAGRIEVRLRDLRRIG